jgi:hypothetical protein
MTPRKRQVLTSLGIAAVLYLGTYIWYRNAHTEVWARDGHPYVIFGSRLPYYLYRPLSYVDGAITGMGFHIGPHQ